MPKPTKTRNLLIAATAAAALLAGSFTGAASGAAQRGGIALAGFKIEREPLARSLEAAHQRREYRKAYEQAKKLDVEPKQAALSHQLGPQAAREKTAALEAKVRKARKPEFPQPESVGISSATLNSIASCESGGNPAAVDSSGTYRGKYQFDLGTWASVGGHGDPAAAPEAEQDYRAALLYSRSGSNPWPICGS